MNEYLGKIFLGNNIQLNENQKEQLKIYYNYLIEYNEHTNLTSIIDRDEVYIKHFLDSMLISNYVSIKGKTILDVGSGAGFPSIPLKILEPSLDVTIVDSLNKRITFIDQLCEKLGINVRAIHSRIEDFDERDSFDLVTARAVAPLNILNELCIPFVKIDGTFFALKGPNCEEELNKSLNGIRILGAKYIDIYKYKLLENNRNLIIIRKQEETNIKYPRKLKQIKNKPL
jgi:16S rRNA (guanine527-N7)-methyltransferase